MIEGAIAFFQTLLTCVILFELSLLVEEMIRIRLEARKGFTGTHTTIMRVFQRHSIKILNYEATQFENLRSAFKFTLYFLSIGLMPTLSGRIGLNFDHSIWVFWTLLVIGPLLDLVFQWIWLKGAAWPSYLAKTERTVGISTVLYILGISLVASTGLDSFEELIRFQEKSTWLIFRLPLTGGLMLAFLVVAVFTSFEGVFSRVRTESPEHGGYADLQSRLNRLAWSLFISTVFLGGIFDETVVAAIIFIFKTLLVNVMLFLLSHLFFRLREDQAEAFILWRLTPFCFLILVATIFFPWGNH